METGSRGSCRTCILRFEGSRPFVVDHKGPVFSEAPASGIHEVLVFSPQHHGAWSTFSDEQCAIVG